MIKMNILSYRYVNYDQNDKMFMNIDDKNNLKIGDFINIRTGNKNIYEIREIINIRSEKEGYILQIDGRIKFKNSDHYITKVVDEEGCNSLNLENNIYITKLQAVLRGYLCRKELSRLKDGMDFYNLEKYIDGYNTLLRIRESINPLMKNKKIRKINYPSEITENIVKYVMAKKYNVMGNWDSKPGDLKVLDKQIEVKGGFIENGPPTFGPNEQWDWIYFVDCEGTFDKIYKVYEIKKSNIYFRSLRVNNHEYFGNHCDQGRRPRLVFKEIKKQIGVHCKLIFNGHISILK